MIVVFSGFSCNPTILDETQTNKRKKIGDFFCFSFVSSFRVAVPLSNPLQKQQFLARDYLWQNAKSIAVLYLVSGCFILASFPFHVKINILFDVTEDDGINKGKEKKKNIKFSYKNHINDSKTVIELQLVTRMGKEKIINFFFSFSTTKCKRRERQQQKKNMLNAHKERIYNSYFSSLLLRYCLRT